MIGYNSNTISKVLLTAALTASSSTFSHDLGMGLDVGYKPLKNISFKNIEFIFDEYNDQATNSIFWRKEIFLEQDPRDINSKFEIEIESPEIFEISKRLFHNSQTLTVDLSEALANTIVKVGKKQTELPHRL